MVSRLAHPLPGGFDCAGPGCFELCDPCGLCQFSDNPNWIAGDPYLCLGSSSPYAAIATPLGIDLVDDDPAAYLRLGPDIGAREMGSTRVFGSAVSTCPGG